MNQFQSFALQHYLSDYPDASFDDILEMVENESDRVTVWEPFEHYPTDEVTDFISHMASDLQAKFMPLDDIACVIDRGCIKEMMTDDLEREPLEDELEKVCKFVETDFIYQVSEKVGDAITYSNIEP